MEHATPLLSHCREVASDAAEPLRAFLGAEAAGGLLLELDHAQVTLRLVVIEGYREVRQEQKHFFFSSLQSQQQIARLLSHLLRQLGRWLRLKSLNDQMVVALY